MGAKDTMKTFFASMNEQVVSARGYGPKIVSTPMGPFQWNDNLGVWVNINNGVQLNNISFQDMNAMIDYDTNGGGRDIIEGLPNLNPTLSGSFGAFNPNNINGVLNPWWATASGASIAIGSGNLVTFSGLGATINVTLTVSVSTGLTPIIYYSNNKSTSTQYTSALSVTNGYALEVGLKATSFPSGSNATGNLVITNATTNKILQSLPYTIAIP